MGIILKVPVDGDSAFTHRLADLIDKAIKNDSGVIPQNEAVSWSEHIVASNADGGVFGEAFVLLIVPAGRQSEGQSKWEAISDSVRDLLADGNQVQPLMRGQTWTPTNQSKDHVVFPPTDNPLDPIQPPHK